MKRFVALATLVAFSLSLTACGGGGSTTATASSTDIDQLVSEYGFQWADTSAPILNDAGAEALSFNVYSSKNASALDYNDMKIMQDLIGQHQRHRQLGKCFRVGVQRAEKPDLRQCRRPP